MAHSLRVKGYCHLEGRALLMQAAAAGVHVILLTTRRYESVVNFQRQLQLQNGSCI